MATWYVSPSGGGNGTSSGSRWTPAQANASTAIVAGDTIKLAAGSYSTPVVPANNGTSGNLITIEADTGAAVKFTANLSIGSKSYLKYRNIELHSTSGSQFTNSSASVGCVFEDLTLDSTNHGLTGSDFVGTPFSYVGFYLKGSRHVVRRMTLKKWYGGGPDTHRRGPPPLRGD